MGERADADRLANRLLSEPCADPDDDLRLLSRQLLRRREVIDLIHANRDAMLSKYEEAARLLRRILDPVTIGPEAQVRKAIKVLDALDQFHPIHGESWCGWPKEEDT